MNTPDFLPKSEDDSATEGIIYHLELMFDMLKQDRTDLTISLILEDLECAWINLRQIGKQGIN
jgi:hypothetical protein